MISLLRSVVRSTALVVLSGLGVLSAQTPRSISHLDSITLSFTLNKDHLPIGQTPWALVLLKNLSGRDLYLTGDWYRIHIEGKNGEPPTKFYQRYVTGKLLPGEAPLRADEIGQKAIATDEPRTEKFDLGYYYDLSAPGLYSVYLDI